MAFDPEGSSGRLIGGSESGSVTVFSPDAILGAGEDAVIGQSHKHTGPVRALDYNRFQVELRLALQIPSHPLPLSQTRVCFLRIRVTSSPPEPAIQRYTSGT